MRRFLLSLVIFLVVASTASGVHASTECQRWFIAYKNALAHSTPVHQLRVAHHRVRRYIHRKLATLKPKPKTKPRVLRARKHLRPKTRDEMLRDFKLACGDELPDGSTPPQLLKGGNLPPFPAPRPDIGLDLGEDNGPLIAANELPILPPMGAYPPNEGWPRGGGYTGFGGGGYPGEPTPKTPDTPPTGGTPDSPPPPPVSTVPEPGSVVLVLTGLAGAAGMVRRRLTFS